VLARELQNQFDVERLHEARVAMVVTVHGLPVRRRLLAFARRVPNDNNAILVPSRMMRPLPISGECDSGILDAAAFAARIANRARIVM